MQTEQAMRNKAFELVNYALVEIAEIILDLEDEKGDLEKQVEDLTRERDELASQTAA